MAQFVFIFRGGAFVASPALSPSEMQAHLQKWYRWADALGKSGHRSGGQPLAPTGQTIRGRERTVTDGPYAESKDLVTGYMVVEARSREEALELARDCPVYEFDGSVEVRPVFGQEG
jgi:hypothetical protein